MEQLLVGADGSDAGYRAVAVAAEIAAKTGTRLDAYVVINPRDFAHDDLHGVEWPLDKDLDLPTVVYDAAGYCLDRAAEIAARIGVAAIRRVSHVRSDPADALAAYARENGTDLIVVGSRGRGPVARVLLGSVSQKIARIAPCSVLIAR